MLTSQKLILIGIITNLLRFMATATFTFSNPMQTEQVGPCHHDMACLQVAEGETVSNMECSCDYIELAVPEGQQGVVLQSGGLTKRLHLLTLKC
jgi:hypothetical protein